MSILVTYGGTKVPIDDVREIKNSSTGRLGSRIVMALADMMSPEDRLYQLRAIDAEEPVLPTDKLSFCPFMTFTDFHSYADALELLLVNTNIDVVFLAAAVADFVVKKQPGKIDTSKPFVLNCTPTPKLIASVKKWRPSVKQVGFKLLSKVTEQELVDTAMEAGRKAGSDITIANDLASITKNQHPVYVVDHAACTHRRFETGSEGFSGMGEMKTSEMVRYVLQRLGVGV
jgi:phosphopantothenoylcysteine synthetase/decarboxylase